MTPAQVIRYYGGQTAAARALGITQPSVAGWLTDGRVPWYWQLLIEHITDKQIKHTEKDIPAGIRQAMKRWT